MKTAAEPNSAAATKYGDVEPKSRTSTDEIGSPTTRVTTIVSVKTEVAVTRLRLGMMNGNDDASAGAKNWVTLLKSRVMTSRCQVTCWKYGTRDRSGTSRISAARITLVSIIR